MDYTMESFIQWCDDVTIAEESKFTNNIKDYIGQIKDYYRLSIDLDKAVKATDIKDVVKLSSHSVPIIEVPNDDVLKKALKKSVLNKVALSAIVITKLATPMTYLLEWPGYYILFLKFIDVDNILILGEVAANNIFNGLLYKYRPYLDMETNKIYLIHNGYKIACKEKECEKLEVSNEGAIEDIKDTVNMIADKYRLSMDLDKAIPAKNMREVLTLANKGAPIIQTPNDEIAQKAIVKSNIGKTMGLPVIIAAKAAKLLVLKECEIYSLLTFRYIDKLQIGAIGFNILLNGALGNYRPYKSNDGIIYLIHNSIKISKV